MNDWKTTAIGVAGAVAETVQSLIASGNVDSKTLITAGFMAALGYFARDSHGPAK